MGLSTFNEPFTIWNSFIIFISFELNPPYIMARVVVKWTMPHPRLSMLIEFIILDLLKKTYINLKGAVMA